MMSLATTTQQERSNFSHRWDARENPWFFVGKDIKLEGRRVSVVDYNSTASLYSLRDVGDVDDDTYEEDLSEHYDWWPAGPGTAKNVPKKKLIPLKQQIQDKKDQREFEKEQRERWLRREEEIAAEEARIEAERRAREEAEEAAKAEKKARGERREERAKIRVLVLKGEDVRPPPPPKRAPPPKRKAPALVPFRGVELEAPSYKRATPSTRRLRDLSAPPFATIVPQATKAKPKPAPKKSKKYVRAFHCRCGMKTVRCPGYKHFLEKDDLEKANEHYNEKNTAGEWVKAVPPKGDPVKFIKVSLGPAGSRGGHGGGYKLVKAPASA